ncbi:MAG: thiamine phosphate synthase [Actinomycetota bacterium]
MRPVDRRARLHAARLYVVTGVREDLPSFLEVIVAAGVDIVQLREKDAEARDLLRWADAFRDASERHAALFIVNDRPDVALAAGADGVHLGQNDLPVEVARRILGPDAIVGLSTHAPEQLDEASPAADYVTAGPVYETPTKPERAPAGLAHVRYAAAHERRPWFAIGGINESNVSDVIAAGATRIVVVRAVTEAPDPATAVRRLLSALGERVGGRP